MWTTGTALFYTLGSDFTGAHRMDANSTVKVIALVLLLVIIAVIFMRRKKKKSTDDEF